MKRFMKLMSIVLVLGVVATASDLGGNSEVTVSKNDLGTFSNCDPYEHALGLCRNFENTLLD